MQMMQLSFSKSRFDAIFSNMFLAENENNSAHDNQNELYFLCSCKLHKWFTYFLQKYNVFAKYNFQNIEEKNKKLIDLVGGSSYGGRPGARVPWAPSGSGYDPTNALLRSTTVFRPLPVRLLTSSQ